jgi:tetratricopeptide (TPR) repeat protein
VKDPIDILIRKYVDGAQSIDAIRSWVENSKGSASMGDLQLSLLPTLNKWVEASSEEPIESDRYLRILEAVFEIAKTVDEPAFGAGPAILLGNCFIAKKQFEKAIPVYKSALAGLEIRPDDQDMCLPARENLIQCLYQTGQFDNALEYSNRQIEQAKELEHNGRLAAAFADKAEIIASRGREGAMELMREAVRIRREPTLNSAAIDETSPLSDYLLRLGRLARQLGRYEETLQAFFESKREAEEAKEPNLVALALSEVGYTYLQAGETKRAIDFLRDAVSVCPGDPNAGRWKFQADNLSGDLPEESEGRAYFSKAEISDKNSAYEAAVLIEALHKQKRHREVEPLAQDVLDWALENRDDQIQINMRNVLGNCLEARNESQAAIKQYQKAIYLADGQRRWATSIAVRCNLSHAFYNLGQVQNAIDVLVYGLIIAKDVMSQAETTEMRQAVSAGVLPLYERLASIASLVGDADFFVKATEPGRALNLIRWLEISEAFENSPGQNSKKIRSLLDRLRHVEVEMEVRSLMRTLDADVYQGLHESRDEVLSEFASQDVAVDLASSSIDSEPGLFLNTLPATIDAIVQGNLAILYLYGAHDGVCIAIAPTNNEARFAGAFAHWPRGERLELLGRWAEWANPAISSDQRAMEVTRRGRKEGGNVLSEIVETCGKHLFAQIGTLLDEVTNRDILIVPQGELAYVPFWPLIDECLPDKTFCISPSLNLFALASSRARSSDGITLLVGDASQSLRYSGLELRNVSGVRSIGNFESLQSVSKILPAAKDANLIHVAAHGIFDVENPYLSGLILAPDDAEEGVFVRYVTPDGFVSKPESDCLRVMTVAECMTRLSAPNCRLAVLSACESGVSRLHGAGEMTGIPSALLMAGAKSVVASSWHVSDSASAVLMNHFYESWEGGAGEEASPAWALAKARSKLATTDRRDAKAILGSEAKLPPGDLPFGDRIFTDAFSCYGAF